MVDITPEQMTALFEEHESLFRKKSLTGELSPEEWLRLKDIERQLRGQPPPQTPKQKEASRRGRRNKHKGAYHERAVAKALGGRKDGAVGHKDVTVGPFRVEVKSMARMPVKITKAMNEARRLASGQTPVVFFRCSSPTTNVVIMAESDWTDWFGKMDLKHAKRK